LDYGFIQEKFRITENTDVVYSSALNSSNVSYRIELISWLAGPSVSRRLQRCRRSCVRVNTA